MSARGGKVADGVDRAPRNCSSVSNAGSMRDPSGTGAAPAEGHPPVGGALAVDHDVAGVGERRPTGEPDGLPLLRISGSVPTISEYSGRGRGGGRRSAPCRPRWPARRRRRGPCPRWRPPGSTTSTAVCVVQSARRRRRPPRAMRVGEPQRVTAAQCGVNSAAGCRAAPHRAARRPTATAGRPRRTRTPAPRRARPPGAACWASVRANVTVPPWCQPASSCRRREAAPTSSTVSCIARWRRSPPAPVAAASRAGSVASRAEHQPPLRPLAPKPTSWRSSTAMRSVGSARASEHAVHSPVKPPPTMATSTSRSPSSGRAGTRAAGSVAAHSEVPPRWPSWHPRQARHPSVPCARDGPSSRTSTLGTVGPRPAGPPLGSRPPGAPAPVGPPAGWYPDPLGQGARRYFDGRGWTATPPSRRVPRPDRTRRCRCRRRSARSPCSPRRCWRRAC